MEILGHSQISMTSLYAHDLPPVMTDAAERIGRALWARREPNCNPISRWYAAQDSKIPGQRWGARGSNPEPTD